MQVPVPAPRIIPGGKSIDDRGEVVFNNNVDLDGIKRSYIINHRTSGFVRAFHGHKHEGKLCQVLSGVFKVYAIPLEKFGGDIEYQPDLWREIHRKYPPFFLENNGDVLRIPSGYANGFMNLSNSGSIQFFSDFDVEDSLNDDIRFTYNHFGTDQWLMENYR